MADDLQPGICSSGSWWNPARAAPVACSTAIVDATGGGFSWEDGEMVATKGRSCDESVGSASGSSIAIQDSHKAQQPSNAGPSLIDSTLQMPGFGLSSSPSMDWTTQALLRSSGRAETNFHALLQEDLNPRHYFRQEPSIESNQAQGGAGISMTDPFKDMNQNFLLDQQHLSSESECADLGGSRYPQPFPASSYGCSSSAVLQGLMFEPDAKPQLSIYDTQSVNYPSPVMMGYRGSSNESMLQSSWTKFPQLLKSLPPKQKPSNQLQFSNNTSFWNASAASISEGRSGFYHSTPSRSSSQAFEPKPSCSSLSAKSNSEAVQDSCSSGMKKSGSEPTFKKPRIETPSPLPTFKVRKEKLGDRITALQQLVSPFGKTDTASVLHEAIEYIKFLHDQVGVLSTPYLKSGHPMQHQQVSDKSKDGEGPKQDLRSRGLCLVPISSTYPVASETTADFWHPTFSGTFR